MGGKYRAGASCTWPERGLQRVMDAAISQVGDTGHGPWALERDLCSPPPTMASVPLALWHLYLDNLVNYQPGSWVAKTASTFRVLAFAIMLPFVLLTLLVRTLFLPLPCPPLP